VSAEITRVLNFKVQMLQNGYLSHRLGHSRIGRSYSKVTNPLDAFNPGSPA
jgi:hypothetical protein